MSLQTEKNHVNITAVTLINAREVFMPGDINHVRKPTTYNVNKKSREYGGVNKKSRE